MESENSQSVVGRQVGNYRLLRLLGRGGFADVYLGEHIYLKTQAAIKLLRVRISDTGIEDVLNEARTIARLEHPNIIRVFECGVIEDHLFLVMNYAPRGTLRQRYPHGSRLPPPRILSYVQQVASALQYAHDRKLIHRDVKPENMLIGQNGEILLSDFGLVMMAQTSLSQPTGNMAGTVCYMPPEQLQGRPRYASDQYALAVIVYEWLCGIRPFTGSFVEVASQQVLSSPPSLRTHLPGLAPEVEQVVLKALAKNPTERFESVLAFERAFAQALAIPASPLYSAFNDASFSSVQRAIEAQTTLMRGALQEPAREEETLLLRQEVPLILSQRPFLLQSAISAQPTVNPMSPPEGNMSSYDQRLDAQKAVLEALASYTNDGVKIQNERRGAKGALLALALGILVGAVAVLGLTLFAVERTAGRESTRLDYAVSPVSTVSHTADQAGSSEPPVKRSDLTTMPSVPGVGLTAGPARRKRHHPTPAVIQAVTVPATSSRQLPVVPERKPAPAPTVAPAKPYVPPPPRPTPTPEPTPTPTPTPDAAATPDSSSSSSATCENRRPSLWFWFRFACLRRCC